MFKKILLILILANAFVSCDTRKRPSAYFNKPFPEHFRDLRKALPDTFLVKYHTDTSHFTVTFDTTNSINFLIDIEHQDTIFEGYAAKYQGLYYLSRQINDSSYQIHTLYTDGYTVKGLHTEAIQVKLLENEISKSLKQLVLNTTSDQITLNADKKMLHSYFKDLLKKLRGDTILSYDLHLKQKGIY